KKFYAVIGNPPYQLSVPESDSGNKTYAPPIYHELMDSAFKVSNKVELITPARFLFDAGSTPKAWNRKMLNDSHFKVMGYIADASSVFPNTDIKGGVAVTYRDADRDFGAIEAFTRFDELRTIKEKVVKHGIQPLGDIIFAADSYHFTEAMHEDHPEIRYVDDDHGLLSKNHDYDLKTNVLDNLNNVVFFDEMPGDGDDYIRIFGRGRAGRAYKFISASYIAPHPNLDKWKVLVPAANGSGALGEVLSTPLIGQPLVGHTQSFISIGSFDSEAEATALLKYIKSKFARTMLGILKITQHNPAPKWKYVPLQDFTSASDIDWTQSVADIDRQLYAKYGLDDEEIQFIESHVKEMN
ncbi:Eco57I restriction-modification methylase domain-containing protein, partial [Atopobiaceae bacterium SGI.236]